MDAGSKQKSRFPQPILVAVSEDVFPRILETVEKSGGGWATHEVYGMKLLVTAVTSKRLETDEFMLLLCVEDSPRLCVAAVGGTATEE